MKAMIGIDFSREPFTEDTVSEISGMTILHWTEVGRSDLPFRPEWNLYIQGQANGFVRYFTARQDGVLKGYACFIVRSHPHYSGVIMASQDVFYLSKDARQGRAGIDFLMFCDHELRAEGIDLVHHLVTFKNDFGPVLERMGYRPTGIHYERRF